MHAYTMNITYRHFLLIVASLLLSACGQFGSLYLPGHGAGYYREHPFTERPIHAVEPAQTTKTKINPGSRQKVKPTSVPVTSTNLKPIPADTSNGS